LPADALGQPLAVGAPAVIDVTLTRADVPAQSVPVIVAHCRNEGGTMRIGFRFAQLKRRHYQAVADLMYGDAAEIQNFRVGRRGQRGIWHGVSTFVRWGVTEPGRGLTLLALRLRVARRAARRGSRPGFARDRGADAPGRDVPRRRGRSARQIRGAIDVRRASWIGPAVIAILLALGAFELILAFADFERALALDATAENAATSSRGSIHRLGPDARQLRFEGESSSRSWAIYVTAAQTRVRARVHLSYSNAISVMSEVSTLAIAVNDAPVAEAPIAAASDPGSIDVELPRGLLTPGYNSVRVAVTQRHRVDCSLEATYELWTQIDPASSGLTFPGLGDPDIRTLDDLAAISPDASGAVPIRAILPDASDTRAIDRVLKAIQAVTIRAGIVRPNVEIAETIDDRPGLWLVVGSNDMLRAHGLSKFASDASEPRILAADVPGQTIVAVAGPDGPQTDAAIEKLLRSRKSADPIATTSAARALASVSGFPIVGGARVSLHDLGLRTEEFQGRLFRAGFDIQLPPDFYPADYDKLTLAISAGYAPGLAAGSQILVRVNDKEAGSLPLRNPNGDLFRARPVVVSLSALRPGVNHVIIEAQTPSPVDAACDAHELMNAKKRFVLFDTSELIMPIIARIARMPNLAATTAGGFPYLGPASGHLFLAKSDRGVIGAAATFLARAAFVARAPLQLRATFDTADLKSGSAVLFGALEDFGSSLFERFGVDYSVLKDIWFRPDPIDPTSEDGARGGPSASDVADADLYDQWAGGVRGEHARFDARNSLRAIYDRYINVHRNDFAFFRDPDAKVDMPAKATLMIGQKQGPAGGSDTWTLIVAANASELTRDMRGLVAPSNWNKIEGRVAGFDPKTGEVNLAPAVDPYFIQTERLTPGNLRLVAAGWMSSNIDCYVLAVALGAILLGFLTAMTVRVYGART
jgi:hypothetical protein